MEREETRVWLVGKVWEKREGNKKIVDPGQLPIVPALLCPVYTLPGPG